MNFLTEYQITTETIEKIKKNNSESSIFYLLCYKENVKQVISYLQSLEVLTIDDLLINRLEFFFLPLEKIKTRFESYNLKVLVQLLNEDINILNNV